MEQDLLYLIYNMDQWQIETNGKKQKNKIENEMM